VLTSHPLVAAVACRLKHSCARAATLALALWTASGARAGELEPRPAVENILGPFAAQYCVDCHSGDEAEAGLSVENLLAAPSVPHRRRQWARVLERLERREMPPEDSEAPPEGELQRVVDWLRAELAPPDCSEPQDPGRATVRRLNRTEYQNTIRDLVGVEFDAAAAFPQDELALGFDNNGDVLSLPTTLLEKYMAAAEEIASRAIVTPESIRRPRDAFPTTRLQGGGFHEVGIRTQFVNGKIWGKIKLEQPGQYVLRARVYATQAGDEPTLMRMFFGDQTLKLVGVTAEENDSQVLVAPFRSQAGEYEFGVSLENDAWRPWEKDPGRRDRNLYVRQLEVIGPTTRLDASELPASHRRLLAWTPSDDQWRDAQAWQAPAAKQIGHLLLRAYRRPPDRGEVRRLVRLLAAARDRGDTFERGMQQVLVATLASPQFLFRSEGLADAESTERAARVESASPQRLATESGGGGNAEPSHPSAVQLNEFDLASRLSYFLWSSMPDDELLELAAAGRLRAQLDQQVVRMLASERADALIRNFFEQWLETRRLATLERNAELFPEFDPPLREALREESFLLLRDIVRNNRPLSTLLTADYGFVNGRLARHYGLAAPAAEDERFVRVELPPERRAGILAQGAVLALTSHEDRTSPVLRGKWVLDHLLADPPPPPPPGVSTLPDASGDLAGATLRERLAVHRADPSCAVCHQRMDPLGLSLQNFDAAGRWRQSDEGGKIDASGELPDGRKFEGPQGLRDLLVADFPRIRRALAEQLLTYALGRGLEPSDECTVTHVDESAAAQGDTFASMVDAIVRSTPFQWRK